LIAALRDAGMSVFVAFASSDVVLWKSAGAAHCGTGKFFNLRRFTRSRFDEPMEGGGQVPYWFEESLLAFVRASDLKRLQPANMFSAASLHNPFANDILGAISNGKAWLGLAWRQYLFWFQDIQARIDAGNVNASTLVKLAEENWLRLGDARPEILMEEPFNNGMWLRQWRRALAEYPYEDAV
jgi:hypothetical protein